MKPYLLDDEPVTSNELIDAARRIDPVFGQDGFLTTSGAARILRSAGYEVEENERHT